MTPYGRPDVASWGRNRLDVFVLNWNGTISHRWWSPSGSAWDDWGSPPLGIAGPPSATGLGDGRILLQVPGSDGGVWRRIWDFGDRGWRAPTTTGLIYGATDATYW